VLLELVEVPLLPLLPPLLVLLVLSKAVTALSLRCTTMCELRTGDVSLELTLFMS
jgi:hypothetical protein